MNDTEPVNQTTVQPVLVEVVSPFSWLDLSHFFRISFYVIIFLLSVVGNVLVIVTLIQNKRMRTVTNVFLLNLAFSDLLLGVFCMPFTLVGTILREFIFGEVMCKLIPYFQAVSVSVSVWTLVAISLERYFAICQPLRSRRWQTLSHAYKMIGAVWIGSCLSMVPIAVLSRLIPMRNAGRFKCREEWPNDRSEKAFNLFLVAILLLLPLIIMVVAYSKITWCLWKGMRNERRSRQAAVSDEGTDVNTQSKSSTCHSYIIADQSYQEKEPEIDTNTRRRTPLRHIRSTNLERSVAAKRHVIRMLFVLVLEFFVCWTPLYVTHTLALFNPHSVYVGLGPIGLSFIHLLAFVSSCCNPITYCFMNKKFRQGFLIAFGCGRKLTRKGTQSSTNGMSFYNARHSTLRTVIETKEKETQL